MYDEIVDYFKIVIQRKNKILKFAVTRKTINNEKFNINIELMLLLYCNNKINKCYNCMNNNK